jgi:hypothetical protein
VSVCGFLPHIGLAKAKAAAAVPRLLLLCGQHGRFPRKHWPFLVLPFDVAQDRLRDSMLD